MKWHHFARSDFFRPVVVKGMAALGMAALSTISFVGLASAASLLDKIKNGETIRIGYSSDPGPILRTTTNRSA